MTCRQYVASLGEFIAGELSKRQKREMEIHRAGCGDCSAYRDSYEATIRLAKQAETIEGYSPMPQALIDSILARRPRN